MSNENTTGTEENAAGREASELSAALAPAVRDDAIGRGSHCTNFWCEYYNPEYLWACRGALSNGDPAVIACNDYTPEGLGG